MSSTVQDIKKRLRGVEITGKPAAALKTMSAAKYYRISQRYREFSRYAEACAGILGTAPDQPEASAPETATETRKCFVLLTGNRGLCGMYNTSLLGFYESEITRENNPATVVCGKWGAETFRTKRRKPLRAFTFHDIPDYSEATELAEYLNGLFESGEYGEVVFVYQRFRNVLIQTPCKKTLLPVTQSVSADDGEKVFYPDKATVADGLRALCLKTAVYSFLLEWAMGAQAATMMAMRAASDSATELHGELELDLNRKRQSGVTSGVIETSSANSADIN